MSKEIFLKRAIGDIVPADVRREIYRNKYQFQQAESFLVAHQHIVSDEQTAVALSKKLHANDRDSLTTQFGRDLPKSAFYTWFRNQGQLVVETSENSRYHEYLLDQFDYNQRILDFGAMVLSGHFCDEITFPNGEKLPVALFDKFSSKDTIVPEQAEYLILMTIAQNSILPLTEDGYVPHVLL